MTAAQPSSIGDLTAHINGLQPALDQSYQTETVVLSWHANDSLFKQPAWMAWAEQTLPGRPSRQLRIVVNVAKDAQLNTVYKFETDANLVRAVLIDALAVGIDPFYKAQNGSVEFTQLPGKGSDKGEIKATFDFVGKQADGYLVAVSNGQLSMKN